VALGRSSWLCIALAGALLGGAGRGAAAQQEEPKKSLAEQLFPKDDPREEIVRLFHEIENKLQAIDLELAEASAGDRALAGVEEGGIEKLLESSRDKGSEVVQGIDRVLELAAQLQGSQGGT
jgi:hypothetical protein